MIKENLKNLISNIEVITQNVNFGQLKSENLNEFQVFFNTKLKEMLLTNNEEILIALKNIEKGIKSYLNINKIEKSFNNLNISGDSFEKKHYFFIQKIEDILCKL